MREKSFSYGLSSAGKFREQQHFGARPYEAEAVFSPCHVNIFNLLPRSGSHHD